MVGFWIFWFCSKSLADAAVSRSRAFPALVPTAPGVIWGRAPCAGRCEILFLLLLGDCASSFLDGTDPSRKGEPQNLADRWRGRLSKQRPEPCQSAGLISVKRRQATAGLRFFA
ncbi:MAG: hypothetical protein DM484_18310 [Candidatus Methylumidiphilus alinenensis]|uniref:Uncharacterized protein n=1 Tax=Candidatus Methylumidiphilus alinenensis TaxID=2202197 RepID=A0A2W4SJH1_9GAMM|nr:MAG: hypothetical protein DM484_18310 [Candidatus Methylumidiphilus alinenensis]